MAKQLLLESIVLDCSNSKDIVERNELYESLDNREILYEGKKLKCRGVYEATISYPGVRNKNDRLYTEDVWQVPIDRGDGENSLGLINHPKKGESPDLHDSFAVWRNHRLTVNEEGKPIVKGDMYLLNNANGELAQSIIEAGGKLELSTRSYGEIKEGGHVKNLDYKSTDAVYEGSTGVGVTKEEEKPQPSKTMNEATEFDSIISKYDKKVSQCEMIPIRDMISVATDKEEALKYAKDVGKSEIYAEMTPSGQLAMDLTRAKFESIDTNNKIDIGELRMNKAVIKRLIKESLAKTNKFQAFTELQELSESISSDESMKDVKSQIVEELNKLQPILEAEYQGDGDDKGSAGDSKMKKMNAQDPEKKIKDTNEPVPDDVDKVEVEKVSDTPDSERTGKTGIKAASSPDAMKSEVKMGEVSAVSQGMKANEDTNEDEPDDVEKAEIDATDDTTDRSAYTDTVPGTGKKVDADKVEPKKDDKEIEKLEDVDLSKLTKPELIETIKKLNGATTVLQADLDSEKSLFDTLSEQYLKLESYTLKAEQVVEMDKANKEKAQSEVNEATEYVESKKALMEEMQTQIAQQVAYIEKLEEEVGNREVVSKDKAKVAPYVNEFLKVNPHLTPYEKDIKKAVDIHEARELIERYNSLVGKVRIDRVLTTEETVEEAKGNKVMNEGRSYLKMHNWL
jgi:hypothetical protein